MATARDEEPPYGGGGAGGKFRKRPFRKSAHSTPYDRPPPPPALAPGFPNPNGRRGGWLSKLVDPAQKLIASGANRLFATVFRKRLPPPPQPPLSSERDLEARNKQEEVVPIVSLGVQKEVEQIGGPSNASGELNELEHILQQKTFTRSEIDRLTDLLHSRTIDLEIKEQVERPEVIPLQQTSFTDRRVGFPRASAEGNRIENEGFPVTPAPGNRAENQLVSTPVVNSTVLEGDAASPAELVELAKSYMHKRPISPSMLGFRSQATVENSTAIYTNNLNTPSRLPFTPLVPKTTSSHADARENGFTRPRSRGKSAIYNMARTPYSRVYQTNTPKGVDNAIGVYGGNASVPHAQGSIKRRSSVLDNDIGSFGAIRRTRQKPNLLSSRGLSSPVSGSIVSSSRTLLGSEAAYNPSASNLKPLSFGEAAHNGTKSSAENGDNSVLKATVPSKSSEMATKILQQLDKLVSPKEKSSESKVLALMDKSSPSKLSSSMLRGQALKSLEHVDSSKFVANVQNDEMVDVSPNKGTSNVQASTSQEQGNVKENGPVKLASADYKFTSKVNGTNVPTMNGEVSTVPKRDAFPTFGSSVSAPPNSAAYPPQKKRAFQMSALEDFVELDDDSLSNGTSDSFPEGKGKVNFSLPESKITATDYVKLEKASALAEPMTSEMNQKTDRGSSNGAVASEKSSDLIFPNTSSPNAVMPVVPNSNVSPSIFNFSKSPSAKDTSATSPTFNFGLKSGDKVQSQETGAGLEPKPSSNLSTVAASAAVSLPRLPEPDKESDKSNANSGVSLRTSGSVLPSAASTSTTSVFSFGTAPTNDSLKSEPSASMSPTPVVFSNLTSQNSSSGGYNSSASPSAAFSFASSTSSFSASTPTTSSPAASEFKFGSSTPSTAVASVSETSANAVAPAFSFASKTTSTADAPVSEASPSPVAPVFKFGSSTVPTAGAPASEGSSVPAVPVFKFGSSMPSSTTAPVPVTSNVASEAVKLKDASFGNLSTPPATAVTTASTLFGFPATTASTSSNQAQGSPFGTTTGSAPSALASSSGTGVGTSTQIASVQFGSSASSPTFGLAGSTASTSAGSSPFGSTGEAKPFSSGTTPAFGGSSTSQPNLVSSSSSSTSTAFGSSWQPPKSPVFSFNSSPSTGFSFGGSTAPSGSSNNSPSSGFSFGASSAPSATNSTPSTGFSFGASSAPSVAASSSLSSGFSFGASNAAANSSPSTGFSFGASSAPNAATNSSPSTGFSFGASSASTAATNSSPSPFGATASTATNGATVLFGSSNGAASSSSPFTFNSSSATGSAQPAFGNPSPGFAFGASPVNNDQMSMEDSMAEDTIHASAPAASVFGQQPISQSPPGFSFGSAAPAVGHPFQFGNQPNLANPQNPSPFQASGSLGSNFSMGSGGSGVDKSNRKFVKVKHKLRKK